MNSIWQIFLQIFKEIEIAKRRYGKLNTILMNAVMEACVHCGDVDLALKIFDEMAEPGSCGVDNITYGTLLKVLNCCSVWRFLAYFILLTSFGTNYINGVWLKISWNIIPLVAESHYGVHERFSYLWIGWWDGLITLSFLHRKII